LGVYLYNIIYIMKTRKPLLLPKIERMLVETGENIKLARLRRKLSAEQVAERANINRMTLMGIEKGSGSVSISSYAQVLFVLGLEKDLLKLAGDDPLGRKLQDAELIVRERAPKRSK
jgi:transcriptional regulator with XRE-family HTH domain